MEKQSLEKLYNSLREDGYTSPQIHQLIFLYNFFEKKQKEENFYCFLEKISPNYSKAKLEQLIKCITHNTPYKLFLNEYISAQHMNELRRYLEDTLKEGISSGEEERYYTLAKNMINDFWLEDMIYQFRRFVKCDKPLDITNLEKLYDYLKTYNVKSWVILNCLFEVYTKYDIHTMWKFALEDKTTNLFLKYTNDPYSEKGDYILLELMEYQKQYKK